MDILGMCSIAIDTLKSVDHLPIKDSFCSVLSTQQQQGGSGTNVLVQAQKLDTQTGVITKISTDEDSNKIMSNLDQLGIDSRGVFRQTGNYLAPSCLIYIDPQGEKMLIVDKENALPPLTENQAKLSLINESDVLYLDFNPAQLTPDAAKMAYNQGKEVVLNIQDDMETVRSRHITDQEILDMLKYVTVFAPCQEGIKGLSGAEKVSEQIKFIRKYYSGLIILTLGSAGLVAIDKNNEVYKLPAYNIQAQDTTGAGDSFIGSFMAFYLVKKYNLEKSLRYSTACSAYTCLSFGAQVSPTMSQVESFMAENSLAETQKESLNI